MLSRRSMAPAMFAAAMLLTSVAASPAALAEYRGSINQGVGSYGPGSATYHGQDGSLNGGSEVALAQPLSPSQAVLYRHIFADQRDGKISAAKALIGRVRNDLLMGQVLAQLYLGRYHRSSASELRAWLEKYNGQPNTREIAALLERRLPRGEKMPPVKVIDLPTTGDLLGGAAPPAPPSSRSGVAEHARALFDRGDYERALAVAAAAAKSSDGKVWLADYMAGLAAWQKNDLKTAEPFFIKAAQASIASDGQRAAGAFWAARTALRLGRPADYFHWLDQAAKADRSFYGMLAERLLGRSIGGNSITATLSEADVESVDAQPAGKLAFGLIEAGRLNEASEALRGLWPEIRKSPALGHAAIRVAARAGLMDAAVALNQAMPTHHAGAQLPLPALHPAGGFKIDPPLLYAVARTESGFDPKAVSNVGARGVMQLMPQTAYAMARETGLPAELTNPSVNMALGQTYLHDLAEDPENQRNLLEVLASYNAGPGAASAWTSRMHDGGDPLIFLESIPNTQTRRFVRQVITDSWIYAEEIGVQPKSLDALAEGHFPQLRTVNQITLADR